MRHLSSPVCLSATNRGGGRDGSGGCGFGSSETIDEGGTEGREGGGRCFCSGSISTQLFFFGFLSLLSPPLLSPPIVLWLSRTLRPQSPSPSIHLFVVPFRDRGRTDGRTEEKSRDAIVKTRRSGVAAAAAAVAVVVIFRSLLFRHKRSGQPDDP